MIEISDMTFSYGSKVVLEDVNLRVEESDFASLVGPNGGGKTTLLKLMLGLLQPERGVVRIFGVTPARGRPRIGYLAQQMRFVTGHRRKFCNKRCTWFCRLPWWCMLSSIAVASAAQKEL